MRTAVAAVAVLVLCLALALAQTPPSFALPNVDDTKHGVVPGVLVLQASSRSLVPDLVHSHRRSLKKASKKAKSKATKAKATKFKKRKTKWAAGQPTFLGVVITVSIIVALILMFVVYLLITEKKKQDPKWRVRDLFKRRLKPGVKRTLTRRFTRKTAGGEDMEELEKPKVVEDGVPTKM